MNVGFRFGVCNKAGRQSSVFRVWRGKHTSDIYVAGRSVAGDLKASLHQSGSWQIALTNQYFHRQDAKQFLENSRHFSRWVRPAETMPGITRAFTIYFPTDELGVTPSQPHTKVIHWLEAANEGSAVAAELMLTPHAPQTSWRSEDGAELPVIDQILLPNGETLCLVHHIVPVDPGILSGLTEVRMRLRKNRALNLQSSDWDPHLSDKRIVLMGNTPDGTHFFADASLAGD